MFLIHILFNLTNIFFFTLAHIFEKNKKKDVFILRCIRTPQSQSGPNNFLKITMCADDLQHLHETNRINSFFFILNHSQKFFGGPFYFLWFLDFHEEQLSCNADI